MSKNISTTKTDDQFYKRADEVINLANEQCDTISTSKVSASLLFAASRFNAFIVSSMSNNVEELKRDKDEAIKYFTDQYIQMLTENLDENIKNYERNNKN